MFHGFLFFLRCYPGLKSLQRSPRRGCVCTFMAMSVFRCDEASA